ncbi:MAG: DUF1232 domain-containing protein [Anaerolineae bacterium]|nr:DUF1232 domain-containing protein [Anaerolineae bacterium]
MSKREIRQPEGRDEQERELLGWLRDFFSQFGLAWKLLWDNRVPLSTKLVPLLTVAYLILPIDIVPDVLVGFGQVDDLVILLVGLRMFISLCPPSVVAEYNRLTADRRDSEAWDEPDVEIIELDAEIPEESPQDTAPTDA